MLDTSLSTTESTNSFFLWFRSTLLEAQHHIQQTLEALQTEKLVMPAKRSARGRQLPQRAEEGKQIT